MERDYIDFTGNQMTWEIYKTVKEEMIAICPFCGKGEIKSTYTPKIKMEKMARGKEKRRPYDI